MMEGMTPRTSFSAPRRTRALMANVTLEPQSGVRFMGKPAEVGLERICWRALMAERTVDRRQVMELVAVPTHILPDPHGWRLMARVASEPHGQVRFMQEAPGGKGDGIGCRGVVTETAGLRRIGDVVAVVAGVRRSQVESAVF
jgi:hypothetical protein